MLRPLDKKLFTVDRAACDQAGSNLSSYPSSYALPLEHSNLIGQLGTARILQQMKKILVYVWYSIIHRRDTLGPTHLF